MKIETIIQNLNQLNFTSIDFETANEKRDSICSVGIVVVRNGSIIEKKNLFVRPREFRFTDINKQIHGITEQDVINAPEFNLIWGEIQNLLENQIVLAFNADFDIDVLKQTLNAYDINTTTSKYICTQKLAQEAFSDLKNYRLSDVAKFLGLPHIQHNCVSDATISAEIGIKAIPLFNKNLYNYANEELTYFIHKKNSIDKKNAYLAAFEQKKIDSILLKPNLETANPNNPFKKIVFTGDLKSTSRKNAAIQIQNLGADINTSISKQTEIIIIGDKAGPSKMKKIEELKANGCNIRLIYEDEFLTLIRNGIEISKKC